MTDPSGRLGRGIQAVLSAACGADITVGQPHRLTGGASRQTWAVDAYDTDYRALAVVLRRDPPGRGDTDRMHREAACLQAAAAAGVPVPAVLAAGDSAPGIDAPYLLMPRVAGESIPRRIQQDPALDEIRSRLAAEMGYVVGLIHRSDIGALDMLDFSDPLDAIEAVYRDVDEPRPAVEIGLRWLRQHRPKNRPNTLVHGDFRLGNLLVDNTGIRGVLDWELAHLGNPVEDLGWCCVRAWRFGADPPVAGLGTRQQLLDGYQRATGVRPTADELHWWEVFGTLKWLVLSRVQAQRHFDGAEHSLELAAIGRRVCESEYDLLSILGLLGDAGVPQTPPAARSTLHSRPTVPEILDLVTETLTDDVAATLAGTHDRQHYLTRICVSLLRTAGRELAAGDAADDRLADLLTALGCTDEADLARLLRDGMLAETNTNVCQAVSSAVLARVQVANPRHLIS